MFSAAASLSWPGGRRLADRDQFRFQFRFAFCVCKFGHLITRNERPKLRDGVMFRDLL